MTTHTLAALVGPFELIVLFVLLSMPVVLTVSYVIFRARFNRNRLDIHITEASILAELAELESAAGIPEQDKSASPASDKTERIYALHSQ
jgi:hypothetical protein